MADTFYDLQPGRTLGPHYHIVEFIGSGWEGEVYKVSERRTGIIRAAKIFYSRRGMKREPLLKYARKLYRLRSCPIVVQYHHRGYARLKGEQVDFLVSDFIDGEMLSRYIARQRGKKLPTFEALHLLHALASGVEQVHFLGEYHGDIHSDNIMVKRRGISFDVYLMDFFDLGRPNRTKILYDVYDMISLLHEMIGGQKAYHKADDVIKGIVMGRKQSLIRQKYKDAGQLRVFLENIDWD